MRFALPTTSYLATARTRLAGGPRKLRSSYVPSWDGETVMATAATTGIAASRPGLWGTRGAPWVVLLLAVAVFGFWKPYFSQLGAAQGMAHLHAASMLAWIGMLVA